MTLKTHKVLLSGASGFIGVNLVRALAAKRIQSFQLVRKPDRGAASEQVFWNPEAAQPVADLQRIEGMDAAIHLSGANLSAHRWTRSYKDEIVSSRVNSTRALTRVFQELRQPPGSFLCASATGIYGDRGDQVMTEDSHPGEGFVSETCVAWEAAADTAKSVNARVVYLRFGVVLSAQAGALKRMLPVFRLGAGGRLGGGHQWMNWISLPDVIEAILFLLETPQVEGGVNLAAPNPVRNRDFTSALGRAVHRPTVLPAPAFALRLAFGEIADEVLLASTRAVPERLLAAGFQFQHPEVATALRALL
jgi:uncharacterized protein (TIGR01777 family)